jgi:hypothetical protein
MANKRNRNRVDAPQRHGDHPRPVTRRQFVAQGFLSGSAFVLGGGVMSLFSNPRQAFAALSGDLTPLLTNPCNIATVGAGKIPFICFDLSGGANIAGSNVMMGGPGGQEDMLSENGYMRLGLPLDLSPLNSQINAFDRTMNLVFHFDSAMLAGILSKAAPATLAKVEGVIFASRSANDTQNNPLNPIYGIFRAGADGGLL